jgi:hypothetical protein
MKIVEETKALFKELAARVSYHYALKTCVEFCESRGVKGVTVDDMKSHFEYHELSPEHARYLNLKRINEYMRTMSRMMDFLTRSRNSTPGTEHGAPSQVLDADADADAELAEASQVLDADADAPADKKKDPSEEKSAPGGSSAGQQK